MKMLGIYNLTNKRFRKDGDEFRREALAWAKCQSEPYNEWSSRPGARLVNVTDGRVRREIRKMTDGLDVLAFFDHGRPQGLPRMRENLGNVKGLAATIAGVTSKITIILYACSCGRGWWWRKWRNKKNISDRVSTYNSRDGYAVALCCELLDLGMNAEVWAHLSAGHTTRNPHVVAIRGTVADWFQRLRAAKPRTLAWKQWKRDLKGPLRFTFWR